jgi:integrase
LFDFSVGLDLSLYRLQVSRKTFAPLPSSSSVAPHEEGFPLRDIRDLLGHANVSTTDTYLRGLGGIERRGASEDAQIVLAPLGS